MVDCIDIVTRCPTCSSETVSYLIDDETKEEKFSCWSCGNLWNKGNDEDHPAYSKVRSFFNIEQKYCN